MISSAISVLTYALLTGSSYAAADTLSVGLISQQVVNQTNSVSFSTITTYLPVATLCVAASNSSLSLNGTTNTTATVSNSSSTSLTAAIDTSVSTATDASGCTTFLTQTALCSTVLSGMGQPPITVSSCSQYVTFSSSTRTINPSATAYAGDNSTTHLSFLAPWQDIAAGGVPGTVEVVKCTNSEGTDFEGNFEDGASSDCDVWTENWTLWEKYYQDVIATSVSFQHVITGPANLTLASLTTSITATTPTTIAIIEAYKTTRTVVVPSIQRQVLYSTVTSARDTNSSNTFVSYSTISSTTTVTNTKNTTVTVTYTVEEVGHTSTSGMLTSITAAATHASLVPDVPLASSLASHIAAIQSSRAAATAAMITPSPILEATTSSIPHVTSETSETEPLSFNPGGPIIRMSTQSASAPLATSGDEPLTFNPGGPLIPASTAIANAALSSPSDATSEAAIPTIAIEIVSPPASTVLPSNVTLNARMYHGRFMRHWNDRRENS